MKAFVTLLLLAALSAQAVGPSTVQITVGPTTTVDVTRRVGNTGANASSTVESIAGLKFDLAGVARPNNGTGAAGAYK